MECPNCHQYLPDGSTFCGHCGSSFDSPVSRPQAAPPSQPAQFPYGQAPQPYDALPYGQPHAAPTRDPYAQAHAAPTQDSYGQPYAAPSQASYGQPYAAPTQEPYGQPYASYGQPYAASTQDSYGQAYAAQQPYPPSPQAAYPQGMPPVPPRNPNGMATASLVLGIVSLPLLVVGVGGILGIVAIVLGILSRKKSHEGKATAGIVLGTVTLVLTLIFWIGILTSGSFSINGEEIYNAHPDSNRNSQTDGPNPSGDLDGSGFVGTWYATNWEGEKGTMGYDEWVESYSTGSSEFAVRLNGDGTAEVIWTGGDSNSGTWKQTGKDSIELTVGSLTGDMELSGDTLTWHVPPPDPMTITMSKIRPGSCLTEEEWESQQQADGPLTSDELSSIFLDDVVQVSPAKVLYDGELCKVEMVAYGTSLGSPAIGIRVFNKTDKAIDVSVPFGQNWIVDDVTTSCSGGAYFIQPGESRCGSVYVLADGNVARFDDSSSFTGQLEIVETFDSSNSIATIQVSY